MSPRFRPPGKTFKERWPQEAEETRYFASTSYAVVVGGVLGVFLAPWAIYHALAEAPMAIVVIAGALAVIMLTIVRFTDPVRRWLALAWKIGAWVLGAGAVGLVFESVLVAMCGPGCAPSLSGGSRQAPLILTYLIPVVGSVGIALLADRVGNALRRRAPSPASTR